jgi:hypothetical protein
VPAARKAERANRRKVRERILLVKKKLRDPVNSEKMLRYLEPA